MNIRLGSGNAGRSTNPTMKMLLAVLCAVVFVAVDGASFEYQCIRLDINGTVTVTAKNTKTQEADKTAVIDLSSVKANTSGNCSQATPVKMTVTFDSETSWQLTFNSADGKVTLQQSVTFSPSAMFNVTSVNGSVSVSNTQPLALSSSNTSYQCDSQQTVPFTPKTEGGYSFTVSQNITSMRVQAFGRPNGTFSPAEHCAADMTTVAPTTAPVTTPPVPSVKPVKPEMFVVKDGKGVVCFRLQAGLQFEVQYETTKKTMVYSKVMTIPGTANVTGTCASGAGNNTATMAIAGADYTLTITETRSKGMASTAISLKVVLDSKNFPDAAQANTSVSFDIAQTFDPSSADTFYKCDTQQVLIFENSRTALYTNGVQLQAFDLSNGSFSGKGVHCSLDPTPSPLPPASTAGDNTYAVKSGNITCIVLKGAISFSNVTYATKQGNAVALPISIPAMNETTHNVKYDGSCSMENNTAQQLVVTFNTNWTLTLTFARDPAKDSSMLTATSDDFSVRDIQFVYYQTPDFFPNATSQNLRVVASLTNISSDVMKGSTDGGSYKCDAQQAETLDNGIQFQTANLQYKAFNKDNSTTFSDKNVSECSADDESNSIVPIAVGAALAGLVVIVLIAYLIGRRRSRRQGYESV